MDIEIEIKKSARRTLALEIKDGRCIVRAPYSASKRSIEKFVTEHENWIKKHLAAAQKNAADAPEKLTNEEVAQLKREAKRIFQDRVDYYAEKIGVTYNRITIRAQSSKWGSCSSKKNLNFNCLLILAPWEVLDMVVVHELCHLKEMNHSKAFYSLVYSAFPEYNEWDKWLKDNGSKLLSRLPD